jgi:hypothetical protein
MSNAELLEQASDAIFELAKRGVIHEEHADHMVASLSEQFMVAAQRQQEVTSEAEVEADLQAMGATLLAETVNDIKSGMTKGPRHGNGLPKRSE